MFFEDYRVGQRFELGRHTFTAEEIKAFAARYDPQPFHLDEQAAANSHFGRLCASGWQTGCVWMRFMIEFRQRDDAARRARGETVGKIGGSPGFRDLQWLRPVYVGDTIAYASEVIETRPLKSRPRWGLVVMRNTGVNQDGEPVFSFIGNSFMECNPAGISP